MKKRYLILILAIILCCFPISCQKGDGNDTDLTVDGENSTNDVELVPESDTDMAAFLAKLTTVENALAQPNAVGTTLEMTQVPVLQTEEFVFRFAENLKHQYIYYYLPATAEETARLETPDKIVVYSCKSDQTYQSVMGQYQLDDQNGYAYNEKRNTWYINFDGKCVSIEFPDDIVLSSPEQISEYFTFDTYYYNVKTAENNTVTE